MAKAPGKSDPDAQKIAEAWKKFKETSDEGARNLLIENYLPLVKYTAQRLYDRLPNVVELDDLIQDGLFGLIDALKSFDMTRGIKFETYCTTRIYGSILDRIRELDWVPRLVRSNANKLDRAVQELEMELGRYPAEEEIAEKLGLSIEDYDKFCRETSAVSVFSLSAETAGAEIEENKTMRSVDFLEDKRGANPVKELQKKELKEFVVRGLKKKEKLILLLYYYEEMTMKEIGLTLEMSESRVCQIHSRLLTRLKMQLAGRRHEFSDES
jgi:RNA polymerase sigma factor for flagellar operon FliA